MKVLITGINGFVGTHLTRHLARNQCEIVGIDLNAELNAELAALKESVGIRIYSSDLSDTQPLEEIFTAVGFDAVVHLAGEAFVPSGWKDPGRMLKSNTLCTINLLQAARNIDWKGTFLFVSSSDVYGSPAAAEMPLTEDSPTAPLSPYASSKLAAEQFAGYFNSESIRVIIARPFNHIGPGQRASFVVPSFLLRIREAMRNNQKTIPVGELRAGRDFTDVRDVVRAYGILLKNGKAGEKYVICSGRAVTIQEILDLSLKITGADLECIVDEKLRRTPDVRFGSAEKIKQLGWKPERTLEESITDAWEQLQSN